LLSRFHPIVQTRVFFANIFARAIPSCTFVLRFRYELSSTLHFELERSARYSEQRFSEPSGVTFRTGYSRVLLLHGGAGPGFSKPLVSLLEQGSVVACLVTPFRWSNVGWAVRTSSTIYAPLEGQSFAPSVILGVAWRQ
jgi:hypothetical protein